MREGSRNEKSEQSVGNILLCSQRTTCNGPVGGATSSDSIRFCSNFVSFRLTKSNLPLCLLLVDSHVVQLNLHLPPIRFQVVLDVSTQG